MAFEKAINEKTKAVIVNTPNNPTGVIYHEETMKKMAGILEKKEKEIGHEIYLISDEPYRELVYDGNQEDFLTKYYRNTIVGYSFSKSLYHDDIVFFTCCNKFFFVCIRRFYPHIKSAFRFDAVKT